MAAGPARGDGADLARSRGTGTEGRDGSGGRRPWRSHERIARVAGEGEMERWGAEEADGAPSWLSSPARAERGSEGKVEGCALGLGIEERETRGSGAGSSSPWLDAVYGDGAREETRESGGSREERWGAEEGDGGAAGGRWDREKGEDEREEGGSRAGDQGESERREARGSSAGSPWRCGVCVRGGGQREREGERCARARVRELGRGLGGPNRPVGLQSWLGQSGGEENGQGPDWF